ncbi:MAG TPA: signal peptidase I, partial [Coriobacteriia bacterium]|nr:signal peptidase I [Coriobacteriia bacterium]
ILRDKHAGVAKRGAIVLLDMGTPSTADDIVKRVIAVAGDTVEVVDDVPIVNGVPEHRADVIIVPSAGVTMPLHTVPAGTIFVMGDNRPVSLDSRFIGPIPLSKIRGKVVWIILPLTDFGPPK